jgi:hypothetical protein
VKPDLGQQAWREALPSQRRVETDAPATACAFSRDGKTLAFAATARRSPSRSATAACA